MTPESWAVMLSLASALLFFTAGLVFSRYRAALREERTALRQARPLSVPLDADGFARRDFLKSVLARECQTENLTGAVIADELGLVVAAMGEDSDALAAYGAVLAGISTKTSEVLPLNEVRQVVLKGDGEVTLTVRKISTPDERFSLVTLTSGERSIAPRGVAALGR